jgi:glycosyltransferase involved in cell wall biosynthesis
LREKQGPVIVAAGRLTPQKDFATLLRAFALLPDAGAKLVIYGEGPLRSELESLVAGLGLSGRVSLPGFVGDLPAEIAASDLFVLSSRWEGLPGVLLEALAVGTPVVATDCPTGPDEILEGGRWGALVPVGDPPALAKAMAKTLSLPIDAPAETVLARFDPAGIVDQYLAVLLPDHFQTQVDKGDTR